jgi:hypothetical protein
LCHPAQRARLLAVPYIQELRDTIRRLHHCDAAHTRTEDVREVVNGHVLWEGRVEVFALSGHDRALRCYAWGHLHDSQWEVTTVLAIPPVISASTAVLAAVAAKLKEQQESPAAD